MPGLPPVNAMVMAMQNDAYRPTIGSTPQRMAKEIASGINARATVMPDRISPWILPSQLSLILDNFNVCSFSASVDLYTSVQYTMDCC